jgi:hypothetical protein
MVFGLGWGPHICRCPGLYLISLRPCYHPIPAKIHFNIIIPSMPRPTL